MSPALTGGFLSTVSPGKSTSRLVKLSAGQKYLSNEKGLEGACLCEGSWKKEQECCWGVKEPGMGGRLRSSGARGRESLPSSPEVTLCLADAKETVGSVTNREGQSSSHTHCCNQICEASCRVGGCSEEMDRKIHLFISCLLLLNPCESFWIFRQQETISEVKLLSRVWLCDSMDCSPPGSFLHRILQARVLERVAIAFFRGSSQPRDWTPISCIADRHFTARVTREAPGDYLCHSVNSFPCVTVALERVCWVEALKACSPHFGVITGLILPEKEAFHVSFLIPGFDYQNFYLIDFCQIICFFILFFTLLFNLLYFF